MDHWIKSQVKKIQSLSGKPINEWVCIEMALSVSENPNELVWHHSGVPYIQASVLYGKYGNRWIKFVTYEIPADEFGLCVDSSDIPNDAVGSEIYRLRPLPELPIGVIKDVKVELTDCHEINAIHLKFHNDSVELYAGEVYEDISGAFEIRHKDESVLIQVNGGNPADYAT